MCKRSLSLTIAAVLFGASAVGAQTASTTDSMHLRSTQAPPAAAASMSGQTHVPGQQPPRAEQRCMDLVEEDPALDYNVCLERESAYAHDAQAAHDAQDTQVVRRDMQRDPATGELGAVPDHERLRSDEAVVMDDDFDEVGVRGAAVAGTEAEWTEQQRTEQQRVASQQQWDAQQSDTQQVAGGDDVEVRQGEMDPFAQTAGTEGFSEGATASAAEREFNRLDSDNSGELSREQLQGTSLAERFEEYDINNDGTIAENEFQSWFAANRAEQRGDIETGYAATEDESMRRDTRTTAEVDRDLNDPTRRNVDQTAEIDDEIEDELEDDLD
jgi:hypothetical protein